MRQRRSTIEIRQDAPADAIFRTVFRLTAISDLYGPERALEWARTLLEDPELLRAFARRPGRPAEHHARASASRCRGAC